MRNDRVLIPVALPLLLLVCSLTSLAYATPPDPSWIWGIYDGADYDDVVLLITCESGPAAPLVTPDGRLLAVRVGQAVRSADAHLPFLPFSTLPSRAPPVL